MNKAHLFVVLFLLLDTFYPNSIPQRVSAHTISRKVDTLSSIYFIDRFVFLPVRESDKACCYETYKNGTVIDPDENAGPELVDSIRAEDFGTMHWTISYDPNQFPGPRMLVFTNQVVWRDVYLSLYGSLSTRREDRGKHEIFSCKQIIEEKADFVIDLDQTTTNEKSWYNMGIASIILGP